MSRFLCALLSLSLGCGVACAGGPSPSPSASPVASPTPGDDVPDTPLGNTAEPQPERGFRASDYLHLSEARLRTFLGQRRALTPVLAQDDELADKFRELCGRAKDEPAGGWEAVAREPAMAKAVRGATGSDPVEYFRLHALVASAYDQYVAAQQLAELEKPEARHELDAARALAASAKASKADRDHAREAVAQAEESRRKLKGILINGFPHSLSTIIASHEKELQEALEEVEDEGLAPTDAAGQ